MAVLLGKVLLLLALLPVSLLGPGALALRRARLGVPERFVAAVTLSLILLAAAAFAGFVLGVPAAPWAWTITAVCAICCGLARHDIARLFRSRRVRRLATTYAVLTVYTLLLLAVTRHYAGHTWSGDWHHHYNKTLLFLDRARPPAAKAAHMLIERPPGMNLVAAHLMSLTDRSFPVWQVVTVVLSTLIVIPATWVARELVPGGVRRLAPVVAVLMACPLLVENATYTWTKLFAAYFAIAGTGFYLAALRRGDPARLVLASLALAAGMMVHYLAAPYVAFCALHFAVFGWRRFARHRLRASLAAAAAPLVLAVPWLTWIWTTYGVATWVAAGRTLREGNPGPFKQFVVIGHNLINTFVPFPLRLGTDVAAQPNPWGHARDYAFLLYQSTALTAMGSVGGLLAVYLVNRSLRLPSVARPRVKLLVMAAAIVAAIAWSTIWPLNQLVWEWFPTHLLLAIGVAAVALAAGTAYSLFASRGIREPWQRWFWRGWILFVPLAGMPMTLSRQDNGLAHVFLQPAVLMAMALIAASFDRLPRWLRYVTAIGFCVDFALGILLHFRLQSLVFGPEGVDGTAVTDTHGLLKQAVMNWQEKEAMHLPFFGDYFVGGAGMICAAIVLAFVAAWVAAVIAVPHSGHRPIDARRS
jgi:hypothetical protein